MTYTRKKSFVLALLVTLWLPVSIVFINPGWGSLGLLMPGAFIFDALFLLPLLVPLLSLLTKGRPIQRVDAWLQMAFYASWVMIGLFFVNGGDTEESIRSIVSGLLVKAFDRRALNQLSMYVWWGSVAAALLLLFIVLARIIGEKLSSQKTSKNLGILAMRLLASGIIPGIFFALSSFFLGNLLSVNMQSQPALAGAITTGVSMIAAIGVAYAGLRRLYASDALSVSILAVPLAAFAGACLLPLLWHSASTGFSLLSFFVSPIVIIPVSFAIVGLVVLRLPSFPSKNIILITLGIAMTAGAGLWQYRTIQTLLDRQTAELRASAEALARTPIGFKLYELTYTPYMPGNPPVFARHLDRGDKAELDIEYSNHKQKPSLNQMASYSVHEVAVDKLEAADRLGPHCSPSAGLGVDEPSCIYGGTTTAGAEVYFVQSQRFKDRGIISAIAITLGNTRITVQNSSYYGLTGAEAMKLADGIREVTPDSQTTIEAEY